MNKEWSRAILLTPIIIGVLLLAGGVIWYVILGNQITRNVAFQIRSQNQQIDPQSQTEALSLISEGEELRALDHNQDIAVIASGVGLILIAAGWLARDFGRARAQREKVQT